MHRLPATKLPIALSVTPRPAISPDRLARDLAALGYSGFAYMRCGHRRNPAEVLFCALAQDDLEPRITEALPWLLLKYADLDWDWLVTTAKEHGLQNRLGYLIGIAIRLAGSRRANTREIDLLKKYEAVLEQSRLTKEDTLCHGSMTNAERLWLRRKRPAEARHWNLLTDLTVAQVRYARV